MEMVLNKDLRQKGGNVPWQGGAQYLKFRALEGYISSDKENYFWSQNNLRFSSICQVLSLH